MLGGDVGEVGYEVGGPGEPVFGQPLGEKPVRAAAGVNRGDQRLVLLRRGGAERQRYVRQTQLEEPVAAAGLAVIVALGHRAREDLDLAIVEAETPIDGGDLRLDRAFVREQDAGLAALDDGGRNRRSVDIGEGLGGEDNAGVLLPERLQPLAELTGETVVIDWDSPQTVVSFAQPGLPMDHPDYFAAFVLNHILGGGGFSSRLMEEIREKRGLTYGVGTGLSNMVLGETWAGGMATANDRTGEAVALVREVWGKIREGVTDREVADAKTYLTGEYPLRFDGNRRIAGILSGMQLMGMPRDYVNTRNQKIEAVTAEDVERVAREVLDPGKLEFVLVGRPEGIEASGS